MTKGDPLRLILNFAIPILIGNIFQHVYSVADTMVAGYNLGDGAIAAIGATSSLYALIIDFAWGMNSGFALVVTSSIDLGMKMLAAFLLIPSLGFLGTCITEPIIWVICALFLVAVYLSKRKILYSEVQTND